MRTMERLSSGKRRLAMALASVAPLLGGVAMLGGHGTASPEHLSSRELASIRGGNDYWCYYNYSCASGCPTGATQQWLGPDYKLCGLFGGPGCSENGAVQCVHEVYPLAPCSGMGIQDIPPQSQKTCS